MNKKAQIISFLLSSFALPIIVYLVHVFLSDNNFIDLTSMNLFYTSFSGIALILEIINILIYRKKIVIKNLVIGVCLFLISLLLIFAFLYYIGLVFSDIFEAVSQYDN